MPPAKKQLLITFAPPGEAPMWVREKWVGLKLPLALDQAAARTFTTGGVLTGPRDWIDLFADWMSGKLRRQPGYAVDTLSAVNILASKSPEAAAWWRENTPHMLKPGRCFVFPEASGRIVDE